MSKTGLIIQREYLTRVKKKSFLIMTILGPILLAGLMIVPAWLAMQDKDIQIIQVLDETGGYFKGKIPSTSNLSFKYDYRDLDKAKDQLHEESHTSILYIPYNAVSSPQGIQLFYEKQPGISTTQYIKTKISDIIKEGKLEASFGITQDEISALKPNVHIITKKIKESGVEEETSTGLNMAVGFIAAIMIYFFIFLYGVQVMRGVIEEKTSRIVEVIISSVKPFQLMLGKIVGIALVGLTQFLLWIILTSTLVGIAQFALQDKIAALDAAQPNMEELVPESKNTDQMQAGTKMIDEIKSNLQSIDFKVMLGTFVFYFLAGYLLYAALFAAIGSAVDSEADTQQFMMPITIPLIFSFVVAQMVIQNPDGPLAFWMSMIPFTSPVIMMVRIPFGVSYWELWLSMGLLISGFLATTWLAGRIYRTGILMYGKKVNYKELWKWMRFKH